MELAWVDAGPKILVGLEEIRGSAKQVDTRHDKTGSIFKGSPFAGLFDVCMSSPLFYSLRKRNTSHGGPA